MQGMEIVVNALDSNNGLLQMALKDLGEEDLHRNPNKDSNHIAWLLWHQTRTEDNLIALCSSAPPLWGADGWHAKFGMDADPKISGLGEPIDQAVAFRAPSLATLMEYAAAVRAQTKTYLSKVTEADLNREAPSPRDGSMAKISHYLGIMLVDHIQHTGQIAYLRGLNDGFGWLPF